MSVEKLERVMWRLRKMIKGREKALNKELRIAIMKEIGTDTRTVCANRKALKDLDWIRPEGSSYVVLTGVDLGDDF